MPKTRRLGILRRMVRNAVEEMEPETLFESKDIVEQIEPEFGAPINTKTVGALLGQMSRGRSILSGERVCGDPTTWKREMVHLE